MPPTCPYAPNLSALCLSLGVCGRVLALSSSDTDTTRVPSSGSDSAASLPASVQHVVWGAVGRLLGLIKSRPRYTQTLGTAVSTHLVPHLHSHCGAPPTTVNRGVGDTSLSAVSRFSLITRLVQSGGVPWLEIPYAEMEGVLGEGASSVSASASASATPRTRRERERERDGVTDAVCDAVSAVLKASTTVTDGSASNTTSDTTPSPPPVSVLCNMVVHIAQGMGHSTSVAAGTSVREFLRCACLHLASVLSGQGSMPKALLQSLSTLYRGGYPDEVSPLTSLAETMGTPVREALTRKGLVSALSRVVQRDVSIYKRVPVGRAVPSLEGITGTPLSLSLATVLSMLEGERGRGKSSPSKASRKKAPVLPFQAIFGLYRQYYSKASSTERETMLALLKESVLLHDAQKLRDPSPLPVTEQVSLWLLLTALSLPPTFCAESGVDVSVLVVDALSSAPEADCWAMIHDMDVRLGYTLPPDMAKGVFGRGKAGDRQRERQAVRAGVVSALDDAVLRGLPLDMYESCDPSPASLCTALCHICDTLLVTLPETLPSAACITGHTDPAKPTQPTPSPSNTLQLVEIASRQPGLKSALFILASLPKLPDGSLTAPVIEALSPALRSDRVPPSVCPDLYRACPPALHPTLIHTVASTGCGSVAAGLHTSSKGGIHPSGSLLAEGFSTLISRIQKDGSGSPSEQDKANLTGFSTLVSSADTDGFQLDKAVSHAVLTSANTLSLPASLGLAVLMSLSSASADPCPLSLSVLRDPSCTEEQTGLIANKLNRWSRRVSVSKDRQDTIYQIVSNALSSSVHLDPDTPMATSTVHTSLYHAALLLAKRNPSLGPSLLLSGCVWGVCAHLDRVYKSDAPKEEVKAIARLVQCAIPGYTMPSTHSSLSLSASDAPCVLAGIEAIRSSAANGVKRDREGESEADRVAADADTATRCLSLCRVLGDKQDTPLQTEGVETVVAVAASALTPLLSTLQRAHPLIGFDVSPDVIPPSLSLLVPLGGMDPYMGQGGLIDRCLSSLLESLQSHMERERARASKSRASRRMSVSASVSLDGPVPSTSTCVPTPEYANPCLMALSHALSGIVRQASLDVVIRHLPAIRSCASHLSSLLYQCIQGRGIGANVSEPVVQGSRAQRHTRTGSTSYVTPSHSHSVGSVGIASGASSTAPYPLLCPVSMLYDTLCADWCLDGVEADFQVVTLDDTERASLSDLVSPSASLSLSPLHCVLHHAPYLLALSDRTHLLMALHGEQGAAKKGSRTELLVDRTDIPGSLSAVLDIPSAALGMPLHVSFEGEEGLDVGGVRREYMTLLSTAVMAEDMDMEDVDEDKEPVFGVVNASRGEEYHPVEAPDREGEREASRDTHRAMGRLSAKAMLSQAHLSLPLCLSLLRMVRSSVGTHPSYTTGGTSPTTQSDIHSLQLCDPYLYQYRVQWLLTEPYYKVAAALPGLCFTVESELRQGLEVPVTPGGREMPVREGDVHTYVAALVHYMAHSIQQAYTPFLQGVSDVVSQYDHLAWAIGLFSPYELQGLVSGRPVVSGEEIVKRIRWRFFDDQAKMRGLSAAIQSCVTSVLVAMDSQELALLLRFVTGSDRVPPVYDPPLTVQRVKGEGEGEGDKAGVYNPSTYVQPVSLPTASVCFHTLRVPPVTDIATMKRLLLSGAAEGLAGGFHLS
ncbi:hypothetical protein KIPB_001418 [Kipferlia bialata]|uniref:HECT-type E3 ubiquitin transferase n=1 Tax=Kipferlia bialata TaxID=797122 RepID=A0A9K3GF89_9EUKA|nr:hypothetical protein KIPB_001418 [Kipferlia bialata]|eukprot:g1418.t1